VISKGIHQHQASAKGFVSSQQVRKVIVPEASVPSSSSSWETAGSLAWDRGALRQEDIRLSELKTFTRKGKAIAIQNLGIPIDNL
jgi:hypothetical protein